MMRFGLVIVILCALLPGCKKEQQARVLDTAELKKELGAAVCSNSDRLQETEKLFARYNAETTNEVFGETTNVSAVVEGEAAEIVIVGAHYDKTKEGCGVVDNWTGIVMLGQIFRSLKLKKNKKTYRLIAFGDEEKGLLGSTAYVRSLSGGKTETVCAMVNLDSFGFEKAWALKGISTRGMLMLAADVERTRGGSFSIKIDRGASSDSEPFKAAGIPSITLSGLGSDWRQYLHTEKDRAEFVDVAKVAENLDFVKDLLQRIDKTPCAELRK